MKNSSELIVFIETGCFSSQTPYRFPPQSLPSSLTDENLGHYFQVLPPRYRTAENWRVENGKLIILRSAMLGAPASSAGNRPVTGFFDGHVEAMSLESLQDMRRWTAKESELKYFQ